MKTLLQCAAVLAGSLAVGCTNQTTTDTRSPIGFETFIDKPTKGYPIEDEHLAQDFGVYGYWNHTGQDAMSALVPDLFLNQRIEHHAADGSFTYSPVKTWPQNGYVNFYAYSPYNYDRVVGLPADNSATGYPSFSFAVNDTIARQQDLLVAANERMDGSTTNVVFDFNHALTQVMFVARTEGDYQANLNTTIKIRSITVQGVATQGVFSFDRFVNNTDPATWWSSISGSHDYAVRLHNTVPITVPYYTPSVDGVNTYLVVNGSDQYLMAMPQSFDNNPNAQIVVEYSVFDADDNEQQLTKTYKLADFNQPWLPGNSMVYAFVLKIDAITFDANTKAWSESWQDINIQNPT